ncbi:hypothetical protein H2199_006771 [Coniosporium tulheliwenetii]|uniref:Uncharacterized protein n=1 Tax=Coniosporium tulheliwenetii TaxID=3383036 RepID=A0ACC2YUB5_9PEZI|nr:hypothetical protein H2199_006771 [Cladosporium sp. JES 115]
MPPDPLSMTHQYALYASFLCNGVRELSSDCYKLVLVTSNNDDFVQTLRHRGYSAYDLPSAVLVQEPYYEVFITSAALERLKNEYDVDEDYDPPCIDEDLLVQLGLDGASVFVRLRFLTRLADQTQPVRRRYMSFLEHSKLKEFRQLLDLFVHLGWGESGIGTSISDFTGDDWDKLR